MTDFQTSVLLFVIAAVAVNVVIYGGILAVYAGEQQRAARPLPKRPLVVTPTTAAELSAAHAVEEWRGLRKAA